MDATYKAELRELNELNFARFDAKLEQRMAQLQQRMAELEARLLKWMFAFCAPTAIGVLALLLRG